MATEACELYSSTAGLSAADFECACRARAAAIEEAGRQEIEKAEFAKAYAERNLMSETRAHEWDIRQARALRAISAARDIIPQLKVAYDRCAGERTIKACENFGISFRALDHAHIKRTGSPIRYELVFALMDRWLEEHPQAVRVFANDHVWLADAATGLMQAAHWALSALRNPHDLMTLEDRLFRLEAKVAEVGSESPRYPSVEAAMPLWQLRRHCFPADIFDAMRAELVKADAEQTQTEWGAHVDRMRRVRQDDPEAQTGLTRAAITAAKALSEKIFGPTAQQSRERLEQPGSLPNYGKDPRLFG